NAPKGTHNDMHRSTDVVHYCGNIFALAFEGVGVSITAVAMTTTVYGIDAEVALQRCQHRCPHKMATCGAMHEQQWCPPATVPVSDRRTVFRADYFHALPPLCRDIHRLLT